MLNVLNLLIIIEFVIEVMPEWESLTFLNLGLDLERKKWTSFRIIIFGDMYSFAYSILIGFEVDTNFSICP